MAQCRRFLASLVIDAEYFDPRHDRCYCRDCATRDGVPVTMQAGGKLYETPLGFAGFGIKVRPGAEAMDAWGKWVVSYHGLAAKVLHSVLKEGGLLLPGDTLIDGTKLGAIHTNGGDARHQVYTSPSVLYAKLDIYTSPVMFEGRKVRVVLQCRQQPGYGVCGETIGWENENRGVAISPHFQNSEIERFTRAKNSVIPYRVLVAFD